MTPNDENATFPQRMKDSHLRPLWRLTHTLIKVRNGALTHKDVKNEGTSGDVYENKGDVTICHAIVQTYWPTIHRLRDNWGETRVFLKGESREIEKVDACKRSAELSRRPATPRW